MNLRYLRFMKKNFKKIISQSFFWSLYSLKQVFAYDLDKKNIRATFSQKKFYKHSLVDQLSASARITTYCIYRGEFNLQLFEQAVNYVFSQHEIFFTTFYIENDELYFKVHEKNLVKIDFIDLSQIDNYLNVEHTCEEIASVAMDPRNLPLYKIAVILLPNYYFKIVFCFHHMIIDGWSFYYLQSQISKAYSLLVDKKELPIIKRKVQFSDYIYIENMANRLYEKSRLVFWKSYLEQASALTLPFLNKPTASSKKARNIGLLMNKAIFNALRDFKTKTKVSNNTVLLAVFITLLYRYCRQESITIIIPRFARFHPKQQSIVGPMLDGLPLIINMHDEITFIEVIAEIKRVMSLIMSYDDIPFDYLLEKLHKDQHIDLDFFKNSVIFNYISAEWRTNLELRNAEFIKESFISNSISNLFNFYIVGGKIKKENALSYQISFQEECIDPLMARFLVDQFEDLLQTAINYPQKPIIEYQLLTHYHDLKEPNLSHDLKLPNLPLITQQLLKSFKNNAARPSLMTNGEQYSYQQLCEKILGMFQALQGIENCDVFIIMGQRNIYWYATLLASLFLGKPFCLIDDKSDEQTICNRIESLDSYIIISSSELHEKTLAIVDKCQLSVIRADELFPKIITSTLDSLQEASDKINPEQLCYLIFTSGSTNKPKLIKGNYLGLSHFVDWQVSQFNLNNTDVCAQITNVHFDVCLREIFSPLVCGAELVVPSIPLIDNALSFIDWVDENNVTFFHIVPSLFSTILKNSCDYGAHSLRTVRFIFFAGEALHLTLVSTIRHMFYGYGFLVNLYGPSETTLAKLYYMVPDSPLHQIIPIGKPLPGSQALIMNKGRLCGIGEPGEIVLRTPYRTILASNDKRVIANPHSKSQDDLLYATGDFGLLKPNGDICILGRIDSIAKINGVRVNLNRIQQNLMELSFIKESCVTINLNENQTTQYIVAHVVIDKEVKKKFTEYMINSKLKKKDPFCLTPNAYNVMDKLPRLSSQKYDRMRLSRVNIEELSRLNTVDSQQNAVPSNTDELKIHQLLCSVTNQKEISCNKMFDHLGVTSLQTVQFLMKLQHKFSKSLTLQDIFRYNTIQKLALRLNAGSTLKELDNPLKGVSANYLTQFAKLPELKLGTGKNLVLKPPKNIFLTGASGFLGRFLLVELNKQFPSATIHCLVRSNDINEALSKLKKGLSICLQENNINFNQIKIILGDLEKSHFSLKEETYLTLEKEIDLIIHCGAYVNFISDFNTLYPSNVLGTKSIIELAASRKIPIHYVSTAGIFPGRHEWEKVEIREDIDIHFEDEFPLIGGYAQTKWVAEYMLHKARKLGIPVSVYRFGRISGDMLTGKWPTHDFVLAYLISMVQLGIAPDLSTKIEMIPVDIAAKLMISACVNDLDGNQTYHIINPNQISFSELKNLFTQIGFNLHIVPYQAWKAELENAVLKGKEHALTRFLTLFPEIAEDLPRLKFNRKFSTKTIEPIIKKTGVNFPLLTKEMLAFYLTKNTNFQINPIFIQGERNESI
ncbi:TPA: AMP-binding protein [Legionella pneumophila subsp. pneumophila]|uniref:thioester reductase domain-containing protein n=1 Tax=Legionella sp. PATHC039 TaxID=2992042 RepID=UPI001A205A26|nr:thioester reductase domain-containing protein [Legionella sp. PATHC039]MCW8396108.1 thioester reductase domain-containing protein [Legionella sp. PATHC039]HAT8859599.1 AMP-binding protein [Legionella pneumophila subsp. pneumophila]HAT9649645.1 AMP-binding protein [Legionella pneumophila subsp. pneumophila]HAT9919604.1 AMP-binding protein [Legionella pneumophila subsp. pneumophila]